MEDQKFDGLSKMLARGPLSRRQVLGGFGGLLAAVGLGTLAPGRAAASSCGSELCGETGYTCGGAVTQCGSSGRFRFCYCTETPEGVYCGEEYFCNTTTLCNDSSDCLETEICALNDCCSGYAHARGYAGFCAPRCDCSTAAAPTTGAAINLAHGTSLVK